MHDEVVQDETGTIQKHLKRIHPSHEIARRYRLQVRGVFPGVEYINPGKISIVDFDYVTCVADGRMCEQQICVIDRDTVDLEGLEGAWPGTRRKPNKGANLAEFEKWSRLVLRACELLAPFETPKAAVSATDVIEAATVTVNAEVNVDLSTLTTEQLIAHYRSRIPGGPLPIDPKHFPDAATLASPEAPAVASPAVPAATVTRTPIETVEETGEKLVEITGEPEPAPATERTAPPPNVVHITPQVLARASVPPGVLEHSRSIAASQAGPQGYGAHQGNPEAGRPIP